MHLLGLGIVLGFTVCWLEVVSIVFLVIVLLFFLLLKTNSVLLHFTRHSLSIWDKLLIALVGFRYSVRVYCLLTWGCVNSILGHCVAFWKQWRLWHIFHNVGKIQTGNARFHVVIQFALQSFGQNIFSVDNTFFSTIRNDLFRSSNFWLYVTSIIDGTKE